jgi:hypothetical protein
MSIESRREAKKFRKMRKTNLNRFDEKVFNSQIATVAQKQNKTKQNKTKQNTQTETTIKSNRNRILNNQTSLELSD